MSKERLEEIERLREIDRRLIAFGHTDWLIEQVKRVQDYKTAYEIVDMLARSTIDKANELKQQNKRYREQLELIRKDTFYEDHEFVSVRHLIRKRVDKALKGE